MKNEEYIYYWYCPACNLLEHQPADSLEHAHQLVAKHEKEKHKGKPLGTFGVKKK